MNNKKTPLMIYRRYHRKYFHRLILGQQDVSNRDKIVDSEA